MDDLSRHLPLSHRSRRDESAATTDRRGDVALVRERQAEVLADASPQRAATLRAEAQSVREGPRRRLRDLVEAVRELAVDAGEGTPLGLPGRITGAVALHLSSRAPFDRRAVVHARTVRAVRSAPGPGPAEVDWEFGHGPVLEGAADAIVLFLLGLTDTAPQPPRRAVG